MTSQSSSSAWDRLQTLLLSIEPNQTITLDDANGVSFAPTALGTWTIACSISFRGDVIYKGTKTINVVNGATDNFVKRRTTHFI